MNKQIAQTIWTQMKAIDQNLCMCMGVQALTTIENGLQFKVSGLSFKGLVQITLNGKDLYDIRLVKPVRKLDQEVLAKFGIKRYNTTNVVESESLDVFVDDMMSVLEDKVENRNKMVG